MKHAKGTYHERRSDSSRDPRRLVCAERVGASEVWCLDVTERFVCEFARPKTLSD